MSDSNHNLTPEETAYASDPGKVALSDSKLRVLRPELYGIRGAWKSLLASVGIGYSERAYVREHLQLGDSRAAVVLSSNPLLVAAYTDELDCVAVLRFPDGFVPDCDVSEGSRLLTVNSYKDSTQYDPDLILGEHAIKRWSGFIPIVAEFVTEDLARVEARKTQIPEHEWQRAEAMGQEYVRLHPGVARDGRPGKSLTPAMGGTCNRCENFFRDEELRRVPWLLRILALPIVLIASLKSFRIELFDRYCRKCYWRQVVCYGVVGVWATALVAYFAYWLVTGKEL